ncbi:MAG: hypothetical protein ACREUL_14840 [Steroidobacteraceae bacterium]
MTGTLLVLWRLLFYRPLILVLLLLVYSAAALLLFTVDSPHRGVAIAVIAAFATAGLSAVLTERITRHSLQASAIGLPDHSRVMRRVQSSFLALFVATPAALAWLLGARPLAALAALAASTAAGIVLATYGAVWLFLVPLLGRVLPLESWVELPSVQALAAAASAYLIWRWFDLPSNLEQRCAASPAPLADARHERADRSRRPDESARRDKPAASASNDALIDSLSTELEAGRQLAAVLALGFGYSVAIGWRGVLYGTGVAIAALAAWQVLHGWRPAVLAYGLVTAICCFALVARLQTVLLRWMRTTTEQALLRLTPRWPEPRSIKRAVLASTLMVQRGSIAVWAASSATTALLGWINRTELVDGVIALLGTSCAFSGAAWAVLAQPRIREWHLSRIVLVLVVAAGVVTILFGGPVLSHRLAAGISMMVVPPALALVWYALAPLRLPLNVDPRALKIAV